MAYDLARKRPYQPSLAAYFHYHLVHQDGTNNFRSPSVRQRSYPSPRSPREISGNAVPQLPTGIQASLLSVGMRVRKAVHDGYRVSNEYSKSNQFKRATSSNQERSNSSEISPEKSLAIILDGGDQENQCQRPKRRFEEEDENTPPANDSGEIAMSDIHVPVPLSTSEANGKRAIAKPKSKMNSSFPAWALRQPYKPQVEPRGVQAEHCRPRVEGIDNSDFGEAHFLCDKDEIMTNI